LFRTKPRSCLALARHDRPVQPGPASLVNELVSFGVDVFGQDARLARVEWQPSLTESGLDVGCAVVLARDRYPALVSSQNG